MSSGATISCHVCTNDDQLTWEQAFHTLCLYSEQKTDRSLSVADGVACLGDCKVACKHGVPSLVCENPVLTHAEERAVAHLPDSTLSPVLSPKLNVWIGLMPRLRNPLEYGTKVLRHEKVTT